MTQFRREKREDYFLPATIKVGTSQVRDVFCKVYLPLKHSGTISLRFQPTKKQAQELSDAHLFSVKAMLKDLSGSLTKIEATEVYSGGIGSSYWGPRTAEYSLSAEPVDLTISHIHSGGGNYCSSLLDCFFSLIPFIIIPELFGLPFFKFASLAGYPSVCFGVSLFLLLYGFRLLHNLSTQ
jgi:hypothetical protein